MAKVMAWGKNREESIKRLSKTLLALRIEGIKTNIPLLRDILTDQDFLDSIHHTGSLPKIIDAIILNRQSKKSNGTGGGHYFHYFSRWTRRESIENQG